MTDQNQPAVTGYPAQNPAAAGVYPPPPPYGTVPPPPYHNHNHNRYYLYITAQRAAILRLMLQIFFCSVIITCVLVVLTWMTLQPGIPAFQINTISVSNINFSTSPPAFTGDFDVNFTVKNPNKRLKLDYDSITADVFYQTTFLTETALQPFVQPKRNVTSIRGVFSASKVNLNNETMDSINKQRGDGGHVPFNLRMVMTVDFNAGSWRHRERFVRVFCGDLVIAIPSNAPNGSMIGGPRVCEVGI